MCTGCMKRVKKEKSKAGVGLPVFAQEPRRARRGSFVSNQLVSVDRRADYTLNGEPR